MPLPAISGLLIVFVLVIHEIMVDQINVECSSLYGRTTTREGVGCESNQTEEDEDEASTEGPCKDRLKCPGEARELGEAGGQRRVNDQVTCEMFIQGYLRWILPRVCVCTTR